MPEPENVDEGAIYGQSVKIVGQVKIDDSKVDEKKMPEPENVDEDAMYGESVKIVG